MCKAFPWNVLGSVAWMVAAWLATPVQASAAPSVAVLKVLSRGLHEPAPLGELEVALGRALTASNAFQRVLGPADLEELLGPEAAAGLVECANDDCSLVDSEMMGRVNTTHLLVTSTSRIGGSVALKVKLLEVRRALEVASTLHRVRMDQLETLEVVVPRLVNAVLHQAGLAFSPQRSRARDANAAVERSHFTGDAHGTDRVEPQGLDEDSNAQAASGTGPVGPPLHVQMVLASMLGGAVGLMATAPLALGVGLVAVVTAGVASQVAKR